VINERVFIESPYAGDSDKEIEENVAYAKSCLLDCFSRKEYPFASHLLYPQVLDDSIPEDRWRGMATGLVWQGTADRVVVYIDRKISDGMRQGMIHALNAKIPIEIRQLTLGVNYATQSH